MKKTVLITGGSSGIGYELSRLFARDDYRLLWVSKPPEELAQAEEKIQKEEKKPEVHSLALDLSRPTAAREVLEWTREHDWEVDVLVNNAGFGSYGFFPENSLEKERTMVALNVQNVFVMTHLFLKDMIKRKKGLIINVASSASYEPMPYLSTYAATKAFVRQFSESLHYELKYENSPVSVMTVCPAPIKDTAFKDSAGMQGVRTFQGLVVTGPEEVARDIIRGMKKGKRTVRTGWKYRWGYFLSNLLPAPITRFTIRKEMEKIPG